MAKKLNEMNALRDMGLFPISIYVGATGNILFTIYLTSICHDWFSGQLRMLLPWAVLLPTLNIIPVLILRKYELPGREIPEISKMDFFKDQHRFASWVYALAAANMFFWIVSSWCVLGVLSRSVALPVMFCIASVVTFVPLWRPFHRSLRN